MLQDLTVSTGGRTAPEAQRRQVLVAPDQRREATAELRQPQALVQDHVQRGDRVGARPRAAHHGHASAMARMVQLRGNALCREMPVSSTRHLWLRGSATGSRTGLRRPRLRPVDKRCMACSITIRPRLAKQAQLVDGR